MNPPVDGPARTPLEQAVLADATAILDVIDNYAHASWEAAHRPADCPINGDVKEGEPLTWCEVGCTDWQRAVDARALYLRFKSATGADHHMFPLGGIDFQEDTDTSDPGTSSAPPSKRADHDIDSIVAALDALDRVPAGQQENYAGIPGLTLTRAGGHCPFQARGTLNGLPLYFRLRFGHASLTVGDRNAACRYGDSYTGGFSDPDREFPSLLRALIRIGRLGEQEQV
ncbi:hypothetical protein ACQEVF_57750 [Nonomuraea polychroma]|uniref:hypothetical protein n=1 Tax=Nonomuraea polychroma TaxID=46176 RepID=UPI003D8C564F